MLPVQLKRFIDLKEQTINSLSGSDLTAAFQKRPAVLLIVGEGGAGKTSLACQIAQWGLKKELTAHRLLPVLIETELDDKKTLVEAIRVQLNAWISKANRPPENIPTNLLEKLLEWQRILVIVDHFSEMGKVTQDQVRNAIDNSPVKAVVITSRLDSSLSDTPNRTIIKPQRIEANRLIGFMKLYVNELVKQDDALDKDPFIDYEYEAARDRLCRMVERDITVLMVKLYTDKMMSIQRKEGSGDLPPTSVQELMLSYINQLNSTIPDNRRENQEVQREALVIAWECLKGTYFPTTAPREDVIKALQATQSAEDPKAQEKACSDSLNYLEERLRLVQTLEPGDKIRVVLDPLAEYLAATYLVKQSRSQENREQFWQEFLDSIDPILQKNESSSDTIKGFLLAVRDCCLAKQKEAQIPDGLPEKLAHKAKLDLETLRQEEEKRRVRILISDLSAPELEFRIRAAEDLGKRGIAARSAQPNLIGMMENRNQEMEARQAAAQTLGKLGIGADNLLALLINSTEDLALRRSAAESLGLMKAKQTELRQLLENKDQPLPIRQGAARALSLIGAASGEPVLMLLVELNAGQFITQIKSIPVWREPLTENLTLDLVNIPAGEFLMGSPADEAHRDWYASYYDDTKGVDVETQHLVTVSAFSMSQNPITQAQWRFVAGLPKVDRELNPDPASYKGDNRPVETVSWYAAMEFCARLSQHTGKTYRLPSEAEWEYACRGGTTMPFHFGGTLSTEIANYRGVDTYGDGAEGIFREKTTEVGSFGVVNAFGLFDMHDNVCEWCLDHWHPSYEAAPTNGSAWITDGDDRYRLLRGGSWYTSPDYCRSARRDRYTPNNQHDDSGFRVICLPSWTR